MSTLAVADKRHCDRKGCYESWPLEMRQWEEATLTIWGDTRHFCSAGCLITDLQGTNCGAVDRVTQRGCGLYRDHLGDHEWSKVFSEEMVAMLFNEAPQKA